MSDDYTSNSAWYCHVFQYIETGDDTYWLKHVGSDEYLDGTTALAKGNARITTDNGSGANDAEYIADDDTIFFVWDRYYSYEIFTGIDGQGYTTFDNDSAVCIVADENGYAKVVLVPAPLPKGTTPIYLIKEGTKVTKTGSGANEKYYTEMYSIGSAKAERVQVDESLVDKSDPDNLVLKSDTSGSTVTGTGLYQVTKNAAGVITGVTPVKNGNFYNVEDGTGTIVKTVENRQII